MIRHYRQTTLILLLAGLGGLAAAEKIMTYRWADLVSEPPAGQQLVADGLEVQSDAASTIPLATLPLPAGIGERYRLQGQIAYRLPPDTTGHLEQWNHLADGKAFFTRSVADVGPMRRLQGHSEPRPFNLPADATGGGAPQRLVLNIVLPAGATATISDLQLIRLDPQDPLLDFTAAAELAPLLPGLPSEAGDRATETGRWLALAIWALFAFAIGLVGLGLLLRRRRRRRTEWQRMQARDAAELA